jgi:hypothetical protein
MNNNLLQNKCHLYSISQTYVVWQATTFAGIKIKVCRHICFCILCMLVLTVAQKGIIPNMTGGWKWGNESHAGYDTGP